MRALHTDRLTLRGFTQHDFEAILRWDETLHAHAAQDFLDYSFREYRERGLGPWAIQLTEIGTVVGNCGFPHIDARQRTGEINYFVASPHRGQGLATEALHALLKFGFVDLALDAIQGRCPPENTASERVLQKAGMMFERLVKSAASEPSAEEKLYRILRKEFES